MKISIITVTYNSAATLPATIDSVLSQQGVELEYLIIDGASTDGTLEIIKQAAAQDERIRWVSEPDAGIYDAMNKGIRMASGEWLNFMNAGDTFFTHEVVESIFNCRGIDDTDFIYSDTLLDGKRLHIGDITKNKVIHQSMFYRKSMHQLVGLYLSEKVIYLSDYLFFLLCKKYRWLKVDEVISNYSTDGKYEKYQTHVQQRIAVDLLFGHTSSSTAGFKLLISPYYCFVKIFFRRLFRKIRQ
jgi:glycosyltransferase involved in cell wall biosynthesis